MDTWALPLDQYTERSQPLRDYVESLMVSKCLDAKGVDWPVPWQPLDRQDVSDSFTPGGARLFDEDIAAQYGYHLIPITYNGYDEWQQATAATSRLVEQDPSVGRKFDACLQQARKTVPLPSLADLNYALGGRAGIEHSTGRAPSVVTAAKKWSHCMAEVGLGDLADQPGGMPGPTKGKEWLSGPPGPGMTISKEEISTAVADAKCRTSSGWAQAWYEAQYDEQVIFVNKNADRLERIRVEFEKERELLLATVSKYTPNGSTSARARDTSSNGA